jgi:hypothetical protein
VVVTLGLTTTDPEMRDAVKLPPVHDVALVELQERVDDCPTFTDVGLAESEAVGAGGAEAACRWMPVAALPTNTR